MARTFAGRPKLSTEQQAVYDRIEHTREHVFVTGRAGTGKSTLLNHLSWNTSKQIVVCAPTGVAALGVGGQTIHSLFRLPTGVIADHAIEQTAELKKLLGAIDTLVIDEVSMVNADLMDGIDRALRQARARRHDPFGGVQVILFGDPYQLPPVPPRDPDERAYFADMYRSPWFFDAKVWEGADLSIIELTEIHRQNDDRFKQLLNGIRHGVVTAEMAGELNDAGARPAPKDGVITLATTNAIVNRINQTRIKSLAGQSMRAEAEVTGEFNQSSFPADEVLELKIGAQVMFLRNDPDGRWVNGTLGTVTKVAGTVWVEVDQGGGLEEFEVEPATWERYKYRYDAVTKTLTKDVVAEFEQFPLRLAWAVTIHKAQGQTYESAIIDLGPRAFSAGQTYVAFSRVTSMDGLYLARPLRPNDIIVDADVARFMRGRRVAAAGPAITAAAAESTETTDSADAMSGKATAAPAKSPTQRKSAVKKPAATKAAAKKSPTKKSTGKAATPKP
ncbi:MULTISPECIES: ATP-dependent RecD-like DNA helicase [unclassified Leucobacter]|uniref:ATP-dependent DNA helicase n=1 Tax=unclassified Leucobacter TaxID=2621730 RepID=UPI00165E8488|nr:DEAD/DEAH box helicase [Leucobacter sp. CX169]MBC9927064.1 AAA family ATPase [Leucobacter sp. cx-169]